jgi:hypothetical protein
MLQTSSICSTICLRMVQNLSALAWTLRLKELGTRGDNTSSALGLTADRVDNGYGIVLLAIPTLVGAGVEPLPHPRVFCYFCNLPKPIFLIVINYLALHSL